MDKLKPDNNWTLEINAQWVFSVAPSKSLSPKNTRGFLCKTDNKKSLTILLMGSLKYGMIGYQITEDNVCKWMWIILTVILRLLVINFPASKTKLEIILIT